MAGAERRGREVDETQRGDGRKIMELLVGHGKE